MGKIKEWVSNQIIAPIKFGVAIVGLIVAVVCLGGSVAIAVKLQALRMGMAAILCGAIGCFVAGILFTYFLVRMLDVAKQFRGARERCDNLKKECEKLKTQNNAAQSELNRLQHQRIDITAIKDVSEFNFAEVDMVVKDVCDKWLEGSFEKSPVHRPVAKKYLGVLERTFKAKLGVDLTKVRINKIEKRLIVSGIEPKVTPCSPDPAKWFEQEVKTYKLRQIKEGETGVVSSDGKDYVPDESEYVLEASIDPRDVARESKAYEDELTERIKHTDFAGYALAVKFAERAAERFVEMILSPCKQAGYTIEFRGEPFDGNVQSKLIEQFIEEFNCHSAIPQVRAEELTTAGPKRIVEI